MAVAAEGRARDDRDARLFEQALGEARSSLGLAAASVRKQAETSGKA